jgi:CheY-like chemotaxis protein
MDKKKILIVEDEQKIARFLELELKYEGYDVTIAKDGREGFEKGKDPEIDLIILDLMLPGLSGIEVCRRLRQTSDVPIIMLTAKDDISDKVTGLDIGADDYMTNPIPELSIKSRPFKSITNLLYLSFLIFSSINTLASSALWWSSSPLSLIVSTCPVSIKSIFTKSSFLHIVQAIILKWKGDFLS